MPLFFVALTLFSSVLAQEFNYRRAYQDYLHSDSLYTQAHDEYVLKRANYLRYQTLVSKEEATQATLIMLQARDETLKTLLTAIRMKIKENEGVTDSQKESLYSRLDPEVKFYEDHRTQLAGAGSLDDLVSASDLAEKRYTGVTENLIYTSLLAISIGKTNKSRQTTGQIASALKAKVSEITENGDKDVSFLDRYFSDMESKLSESQKKAEEAEKVMAKAEKAAVRSRSSYYLDALGNVQGAYNYIKEVATNLEEMVRLIKTN